MTNTNFRCLVAALSFLAVTPGHAQEDVSDLREALNELRGEYEQRISDLEKKLEEAIQSSKTHRLQRRCWSWRPGYQRKYF